ncbi:hypothetical protein CLI75_05345 [Porphyromonas gingivalis]|nr:hypothetical protein SJDPG4_06050 [Porphyromonas gingivalis SJD4]PDP58208.1 hypothetical protein CLI75_05345 [Porphyromonas gingivalis]
MRPAYHDAKLQFFLYVAHFHSDSFATVLSGSAVTTSANSLFGSFSTFVFDKAYIGKNTWHPKALLYEYNYKTQTAKIYIHVSSSHTSPASPAYPILPYIIRLQHTEEKYTSMKNKVE